MLAAIGLDRRSVYIANVVPWRPPGNRTPTLQETQACLPFIRRQIDLADPKILVCLGGSAVQTLLGVQGGITRVRGSWFDYERDSGPPIRALAMFHPAYLLRQPAQKRLAWADMRALAKALDQPAYLTVYQTYRYPNSSQTPAKASEEGLKPSQGKGLGSF